MGAVIFTVVPLAALCCVQLLGLRHSRGHEVLTTATAARPWATQGSGHFLLLCGKMSWAEAACAPRWEQSGNSACPTCFSFPQDSLTGVSVPALQFIQCGYLWALDWAHQCFECNFLRGIWTLFSFSCTHIHFPIICPWAMNPCLPLQPANSLLGASCVTPKSAAKRMNVSKGGTLSSSSFLPKAVVIQWVVAASLSWAGKFGYNVVQTTRWPFQVMRYPHCKLLFQHIYWFCDSKYLHLILQVSYFPPCVVFS